ncbi:MAG TPA: hypothetical protein VLA77_03780 [Candidatus Saccharimonadales bacterium]|nr:hypothetical protein [Candidatus Saccharimonadales bacterium]
MSSSTKISRGAAIEILKGKVFGEKPTTDTVYFADLITRNHRENLSKDTNRSWTNSITQKLVYHEFVTKVYEDAENPRSKIVGIKLTQRGKAAISESTTQQIPNPSSSGRIVKDKGILNIDEAVIAIEEWRIKNPWATRIGHASGWEIIFNQKGASDQ